MKRLAFVLVLAAACGGKKTPEPTKPVVEHKEEAPPPTEGSGSATAEAPKEAPAEAKPAPPPTPAEDTFLKLSKDEKTKIMKDKVMPAMSKAFKEHDAKRYKKFECKTCHGKGAGKGFKMPNPDLPKLDFAKMQSGELDAKTKEMVEFMEKTVKPQMADMLGLTQFDPMHPELGGFGCLACHEAKK